MSKYSNTGALPKAKDPDSAPDWLVCLPEVPHPFPLSPAVPATQPSPQRLESSTHPSPRLFRHSRESGNPNPRQHPQKQGRGRNPRSQYRQTRLQNVKAGLKPAPPPAPNRPSRLFRHSRESGNPNPRHPHKSRRAAGIHGPKTVRLACKT